VSTDDEARPGPGTTGEKRPAIPEGRRPEGGGFDRTPPQDVPAEQCALGGMLLSKDAVADVVEILKPSDFYKPQHATVFDAILDLYGRGEPADAITVAAALNDSGNLARIGGAPYLHTLIATVPTAANAAYYARIVAERAILRRLVEAGTKIVQLGYGASQDVDDTVDLAQQAIYDVTERRVSEDFAILGDMLQPTLDEIEAVGASGGMMTGVPTGFGDLDRLLNGLHAGQLVIVAGRPGLGKALALDTPLPTPDGWTTMGEVRVGDLLIGADGKPVVVTAATEVQHDRRCFEVEFSDGSVIVADADHRWLTHTHQTRRNGALPQVNTTDEILATLRTATVAKRLNHSVSNTKPLQLPERELPIPPLTFGRWLGNGLAWSPRITTDDLRFRETLAEQGFRRTGADTWALPVSEVTDANGRVAEGSIPATYLRASEEQRRALLAGLLDCAGSVTRTGKVQYRTTSRKFADDVYELVVGLGYRCDRSTQVRSGGELHVLRFVAGDDVFGVEHRNTEHRQRRTVGAARGGSRFITDVRPVASVPVRCVTVDNADHLYLAGRSMIPTHNSTAAMDFARSCSLKHNMASAIFSLEMSKVEIVMRLLSAEARVPLHVLRSGQLSDDDWTKLARRMGEISEAPLFVDDTPNMNLMEIRAKARRLKQRHDLKLLVVDYLQLMTSPKKTESRQQEVSELSRGLKLLAKEVECPVIAVSQLNRGPEQRTDKRPQLSDLRESGCLTAETRLTRADTNAEITLGELLGGDVRDIPVWALDERLKYVPRTLTHAFPSGRKATYRMTLASGRSVEATGNHPFLSFDGWRALEQLAPGSRIAVPRHVPPPLETQSWPEPQLIQLARTVSDDGYLPEAVFALPKAQVTLFLRHLWATDGSVTVSKGGRGGRIHYSSTSRQLADGVMRLLLRFGISARLRSAPNNGHRPSFTVDISGRDEQRRFVREIGVHGARSAAVVALQAVLEGRTSNPHVDTVPVDVWDKVRSALADQRITHRQFAASMGTQFCGSAMRKHAPSRQRLARVAHVLDSAELDLYATNDVLWDEVVRIESIGERDVYDATVLGLHNFIANGIAAHNSIEQDADVVILLHRDDYYDKESPRAGEADFIVAKHRNGPTDTITVAAQLHLSRFVDMAI